MVSLCLCCVTRIFGPSAVSSGPFQHACNIFTRAKTHRTQRRWRFLRFIFRVLKLLLSEPDSAFLYSGYKCIKYETQACAARR